MIPKRQLQGRERGMTLLTILLLVVAITIVAGSMLASQKIMQRQYALSLSQDQMREYALAGEAWASQLILQDSHANQSDSLQDSWAQPLAPMTLDNATIEVTISDEAARFNLNNLYHDGKVDEAAMAFFRKLLISQNINPAIANAVLDWQDPDSDPRPEGGAEFDFYQSTGKTLPMPIANQPFTNVDELAWVRGMQKADFEKLKPLVTAVPFFLPMNVNTVKPELLVAMLSTPDVPNSPNSGALSSTSPLSAAAPTTTPGTIISPSQIMGWTESRAAAIALNNMNEFWTLPMFAVGNTTSASQKQNVQSLLDVKSRAFSDVVKVSDEGRTLYLTSILAKHSAAQPPPNQVTVSNSPDLGQSVVAFNRRLLPFLPSD